MERGKLDAGVDDVGECIGYMRQVVRRGPLGKVLSMDFVNKLKCCN